VKRRIIGAPAAAKSNEIDRGFLRELRQLCHPDRHNSSPLSLKVSQRLNEIGKELDKPSPLR
jgi:hypothetical protein